MASSKNFTEVLIGGKVFTLSGFESEDYLQKVSTYLNHKLDELGASDGYRKQNAETRSILLALLRMIISKQRSRGLHWKTISRRKTRTCTN